MKCPSHLLQRNITTNGGDHLVPSWITNLLKETVRLEYYTSTPFRLIGQDGAPFTVLGFSKGCFFRSPFFTIMSMDCESHCAVLEVLVPCGNELFHTEARVLVRLNCFCSFEIVSKPVFDCLEQSQITKDQFCLPFKLTKNDSPKTICRIDRNDVQHMGTISVHYTGTDPEVKLTLYTKEETISLTIPRGKFRSITGLNLQSIEIANPIESVKGTIDTQLNFCEKKTIYF